MGGKKNTKYGDHVAGKKNNTNGSSGSNLDTSFPPLVDDSGIVHTQDDGLNDGGTITGGVLGQVPMFNAVKVSGNDPSNSGPIPITKVISGIKDDPSSYANKLSPTSVMKSNLQKLDANVPNDADYDFWLPLASFHEVSDRMKNSLYRSCWSFPIFLSSANSSSSDGVQMMDVLIVVAVIVWWFSWLWVCPVFYLFFVISRFLVVVVFLVVVKRTVVVVVEVVEIVVESDYVVLFPIVPMYNMVVA
ncbi:hypothetical protein Tco_1500135 [Tanacetum coccineum]